jgi:hypothetical protein
MDAAKFVGVAAALFVAACAASKEVAGAPTEAAQPEASPWARLETIPRPAVSPGAPALSAAFEPLFVAEFADRAAARAAWRNFGAPLLDQAEPSVYPPLSTETFSARALARVRIMRSSRPDASLEDLSYAALDGLFPPERLSEDFLTAVTAWTVEGSQTDDNIPLTTEAEEIDTILIGYPEPELKPAGLAGTDVLVLRAPGQRDAATVRRMLAGRSGPLVLNLRGDGGGQLAGTMDVASLLTRHGGLLFSVTSADQELRAYAAAPDPAPDDDPILVVIDERTNGIALWLAAALADAGRAKIAGTRAETVRGGLSSFLPWAACRSVVYRCEQAYVTYPSHELVRANGALLSDGVAVDYPVDAWDDAALEAVVARWRADVAAP